MTTPSPVTELRTTRTLLRAWRDADRDPFAAMCADPVVMEFFPNLLTRAESDAFVDRRIDEFRDCGWGLWAVEIAATGQFAGFVGLSTVGFAAPFTPATEIGWRLAQPFWGSGIATEAALTVLEAAFGPLAFDEIVSFTAEVNRRSQRVMQKIGMHRDHAGDFDHPRVPEGHPLRPHALYRISRSEFSRADPPRVQPV